MEGGNKGSDLSPEFRVMPDPDVSPGRIEDELCAPYYLGDDLRGGRLKAPGPEAVLYALERSLAAAVRMRGKQAYKS